MSGTLLDDIKTSVTVDLLLTSQTLAVYKSYWASSTASLFKLPDDLTLMLPYSKKLRLIK